MTDIDHDERLLISRARNALSPREADAARILSSLEQRLDVSPREPGFAEPGPRGVRGRFWRRSGGAALSKAFVGSVLLGTLGALVSSRHADDVTVSRAPVPTAVSKVAVVPPSAAEASDRTPAAPAPPAVEAPAAPVAIQRPSAADRQRRKRVQCSDSAARTSAACRASSRDLAQALAAPPLAVQSSLRAELSALQQAERALRAEQPKPKVALELLDAFERDAADGGKMHEERSALRAVARCSLEPASGLALSKAFTQRYPGSAYAERVARTCARTP
jgi:hypothetical protein